MFKKFVAILMASVMLLLPVTGSAVTWGNVVSQLNASGSYAGEGVSAKLDGSQVTVEGTEAGAMINGSDFLGIFASTVKGATAYLFKDVELSANQLIISNSDADSMSVIFDKGTVVNASEQFSVESFGKSISFTNNGTVDAGSSYIVSGEGGSATAVNNGEFIGSVESNAYVEGNTSFTNNGTVDYMGGYATENSNTVLLNNGEASELSMYIRDGSTGSVTNEGQVASYLGGAAYVNGTVTLVNNGTVGEWVSVDAGVDSTANATLNGSVPGLGLYVDENGVVNAVNNAKPAESYISFWPTEDNKIGSVSVSGDGSLNNLEIGVSAPYSETEDYTFTEEERQQIASDLANSLSIYANQVGMTGGTATMEVTFWDNSGEEPVVMKVEVPLKLPEPEDKGPTEEQIRHEMEMKRQAEGLAGVYASPYWCRQMFLGYRSMNFSIHNAESEKVLFRERLGWLNGGPRKNLNLRVRTDETEGLTIRFDEEVLDILERAEIDTLTLLTYTDKEAFMQYNVSDLRAAREKYGLAPEELLIIGGMDDEVMKGTVDGSIVPVE